MPAPGAPGGEYPRRSLAETRANLSDAVQLALDADQALAEEGNRGQRGFSEALCIPSQPERRFY